MTNSKKNKSTQNTAAASTANDIRPGQSIELLKHLHILTADGKMNQDSRRKLKQVYHLFQFIEPLLNEILVTKQRGLISPDDLDSASINLVDHGAGKSYLGFILYDLYFKNHSGASKIYGIETRTELVQKSIELKNKLQFSGMEFLGLSVKESLNSSLIPDKVDIVTTLHACNTATDDAIQFALQKKSDYIVLVPCCQAEVASVLKQNKSKMLTNPKYSQWVELFRHPIHTREFGSHLTNVLRCLQLEAHGYHVNVTELVGWEHSMKNELIIATQKNNEHRNKSKERLQFLLETFNLKELSDRFSVPD
jgi:hypothetical protein